MLKFILIPILALVLSGGSYYVESNPTNLFSTEGRNITSRIFPEVGSRDVNDGEVRTRGFPVAWVDEFGSFDGTAESFDTITDSFSTAGFAQNSGIWLVVAGALYFFYSRIRNLVGNVVILGAGAALAASYFGLITFA